jgi:hypothetical protein
MSFLPLRCPLLLPAVAAASWPIEASAHPEITTDVGSLTYVVATAVTVVLMLVLLLLPRLFRLVRSTGRRR